jgi:hypothetical protein
MDTMVDELQRMRRAIETMDMDSQPTEDSRQYDPF